MKKIAQRTNYGMKDFQTLCSRAKCVPIPTSTLNLKLLLCIAYQVCTCYHHCYHHITQQMLCYCFLWFSTTNKQPNTTHWSQKPVDNYCKCFFSLRNGLLEFSIMFTATKQKLRIPQHSKLSKQSLQAAEVHRACPTFRSSEEKIISCINTKHSLGVSLSCIDTLKRGRSDAF